MIRQLRALRIILQKPRMYSQFLKALERAKDATNLKSLFEHYEGRPQKPEIPVAVKSASPPKGAMFKKLGEALQLKVQNFGFDQEFYDKTVRLVFRGKADIDFEEIPLGWDSQAEKFDGVELEGEKFPMPDLR